MSQESLVGDAPPESLTPQQCAYFETFGYVILRGLFRTDIAAIAEAFEQVFAAQPPQETSESVHGNERRLIVPNITERHQVLGRLPDDPRLRAAAHSLIGDDIEYAGSDGNLYFCETYWHSDTYGSPVDQYHVKFSLYLDPVDSESGAIRVIPGSHFMDKQQRYSGILRQNMRPPAEITEKLGVEMTDIPSVTLDSEPGDVVAWNYRIMHASFNGVSRRRHLSIGFREPAAASA